MGRVNPFRTPQLVILAQQYRVVFLPAAITRRLSARSQNLRICLVSFKGTGLPVPYPLHSNRGFSR
jgi:hypothetical protein